MCHIHNTTYWAQEFRHTSYLHVIYRFFPPYHTVQDDIQLKDERILRQHHYQSIIQTQLTPDLFDRFFACRPFSFYLDCREFFWLQHTLFNTGRSRTPNHKGTTSSFISGSNFTCLIRVQPWKHRPIHSHSHSATCWTQEITFNPFLHCAKHGQLRDVYTIFRQWYAACPDARGLWGPVNRCLQI